MTTLLSEFYVENVKVTLDQIRNVFCRPEARVFEVFTFGKGSSIVSKEPLLSQLEKRIINNLKIESRLTWSGLICLLSIFQVNTLYLYDSLSRSFQQDDCVEMRNIKVVSILFL